MRPGRVSEDPPSRGHGAGLGTNKLQLTALLGATEVANCHYSSDFEEGQGFEPGGKLQTHSPDIPPGQMCREDSQRTTDVVARGAQQA